MAATKTEKRIIMATGAVLLLFVFSVLYATGKHNIPVPGHTTFQKAFNEPKITKLNNGTYQVFAVASMWKFEPAAIKVPAGSDVEIFVTSKDIVHAFSIPSMNVNLMAMYGTINKTKVKFDEPGVYKITGIGYCGTGHQDMQAEVIVKKRNAM